MVKINWKVRIRHRQFWVALISAIVLLANQVASIFDVDITVMSAKIQQSLESLLLVLALFGIIIDPTTVGVKDSSQAMVYTKPRNEADEVPRPIEKVEERQQETKIEVQHETKIEVVQQQQDTSKEERSE